MFKWIYDIFYKKEVNMSDTKTGSTRSDTKLKKQLADQRSEIGKLRGRVNELVDNMVVLENDLKTFKKNVSKDLLDVVETLKEQK
jgi:archaellum component FlaC